MSLAARPPVRPSAWSLHIHGPATGATNMALDQALLDRAEQHGMTSLRLYQWEPHCLSLGRNEPAIKRYDRAAIEHRALSIVRRPTGGRAVWHARELTYAVAAPLSRFGGLAGAYREIHLLLADALKRLGAEPVLAPAPTRVSSLSAGACFATSAGGELLVSGAKIVGSAQLTQGSAFLQHGSVLLQDGQSLVVELGPSGGAARPGHEAHLTGLLGRTVEFGEAAAAVEAAAIECWGAPATNGAAEPVFPTPEHLERFSDPRWTWRR
jgi:lipoate-protein ligase A